MEEKTKYETTSTPVYTTSDVVGKIEQLLHDIGGNVDWVVQYSPVDMCHIIKIK